MAVNAIQSPFATDELSNGLVVIVEPINWLVRARLESHGSQIIIAAVVARVALGIWNGGGQTMHGLLHVTAGGGCVTGRTSGEATKLWARYRLRLQVAGQAVVSKS